MIVVKVEYWPGGNPEAKQDMDTMYIKPTGPFGSTVRDYSVHSRWSKGNVRGHDCGLGFWPLIKRAIQNVKEEP